MKIAALETKRTREIAREGNGVRRKDQDDFRPHPLLTDDRSSLRLESNEWKELKLKVLLL